MMLFDIHTQSIVFGLGCRGTNTLPALALSEGPLVPVF